MLDYWIVQRCNKLQPAVSVRASRPRMDRVLSHTGSALCRFHFLAWRQIQAGDFELRQLPSRWCAKADETTTERFISTHSVTTTEYDGFPQYHTNPTPTPWPTSSDSYLLSAPCRQQHALLRRMINSIRVEPNSNHTAQKIEIGRWEYSLNKIALISVAPLTRPKHYNTNLPRQWDSSKLTGTVLPSSECSFLFSFLSFNLDGRLFFLQDVEYVIQR